MPLHILSKDSSTHCRVFVASVMETFTPEHPAIFHREYSKVPSGRSCFVSEKLKKLFWTSTGRGESKVQ